MSTARAVRPHLPRLRRYASVLTGSIASGDAYVAAVLEALIEDPLALGANTPARLVLYKVLTKIWNSLSVNVKFAGAESGGRLGLGRMAPQARQALLLTALEGFSDAEAAEILELDVRTIRRLIWDAQRELAAADAFCGRADARMPRPADAGRPDLLRKIGPRTAMPAEPARARPTILH